MKRLILATLLLLCLPLAAICQRTTLPPGAGGGISSCVAPSCINATNPIYAGGASPANSDNAAAFAAVSAAVNASAYTSVGVPAIRSSAKTPLALSITSATASVSITPADTVVVGVLSAGATGITFTVSDGVNNYYPLSIVATPVGENNQAVQLFGTVPGLAKAFSGTLTVTASGSANFGLIVLDAFNVGSYSQLNLIESHNDSSSSTPSVTAGTQDANNIIASWFMYQSSAVTVSAGTGTLQQSYTGPSNTGGGLITNSAVSFNTSLTTSAALSAGTPWVINGLELRSVKTLVSTVYIPNGYYAYSSGLSFTNPVTLKGDPGSTLCYTGTAHAVDMGPVGLVIAQGDAYTVDGPRFECGAGMTEGIVFANNAILTEVKNAHFYNFGNLTSCAIFSNGNTQDLSIKLNHFTIWEAPPPPPYNAPARCFADLTTNAQFSTLTMTNNYAFCASGRVNGGVGCGTYLSPFIKLAGYFGIISNNSFAGGFCPWVQLGGATSAYGTKIEGNDFEVDTSGCYAITYTTGQHDGLKVINNSFNNKASTPTSLIGPAGSAILTNVEVSNNYATNQPLGIPLVAQNNTAGQTGNIGWHNTCSTGGGTGTTPCALLHTTGANISQWNADRYPKLTFAAGTTASYTFGVTYGVAPVCTIPPNIPGTATTLTITTLSTTTLTITASASNSATVNAVCSEDDAQ